MVASSTVFRTAVVTGSARRVGRVIAETLVAGGWKVLVHATSAEAARDAAANMGAVGSVGADLADAGAAEQIAMAARLALGDRLDLLVNSASSFERTDGWSGADEASFARAFDVNVRAPYQLMSALRPQLEAAGGAVINVSDRAAHEHWSDYPLHAASKAALESLTHSGAAALAGTGTTAGAAPRVRVNAIAPGTILAPESWSDERIERERAAGTLGTPDALIMTLLALANDSTRTGEIITL